MLRRYEILLPLRSNDRAAFPDELYTEVLIELRVRFGAATWETQALRGEWQHEGRVYRDQLTRMFVDVEDDAEVRQFFRAYKETLKTRFRQIDI